MTVTVPVVEAEIPANVLAVTMTVHVPVDRPLIETTYVTLLPGLFVPVKET